MNLGFLSKVNYAGDLVF